jgi:hypothetical protein
MIMRRSIDIMRGGRRAESLYNDGPISLQSAVASRARSDAVRRLLLRLAYRRSRNLVAAAVKETGLTRQAIHGHLARLVADGSLIASGRTKARKYTLATFPLWRREYANQNLQEDRVWNYDASVYFSNLPDHVKRIWSFGCSEMLNNAIEHSGSDTVTIEVSRTALSHEVVIRDSGIGIFRKLREALELSDDRDALIELMKGKVTTDPLGHSGQGIFFTSRMFDFFLIASGGLVFSHQDTETEDLLGDFEAPMKGTSVLLELADDTERSAKEIFDKYSSTEDDYAFIATDFPVRKLKDAGEELVSRSQARRLMTRLEKFARIELDFSGVEDIGQAFADEIFRVFATAHPSIAILPRNANRRVMLMIRRAQSAG